MNIYDPERDCEIHPSAMRFRHWGGLFWDKFTTCENYEIFPKLKICHGMKQLSTLMIERYGRIGKLFDGFFLVLVLFFVVFFVTSIYKILFAEDRKPLKEITQKVKKSTDAVVSIFKSLLAIKEAKVSNLILESENEKLLKMKIPAYIIDAAKIESLKNGAFISIAEIRTIDDQIITEISYTQEEEFPVESEWIPRDEQKITDITDQEIEVEELVQAEHENNDDYNENVNENVVDVSANANAQFNNNNNNNINGSDGIINNNNDSNNADYNPSMDLNQGRTFTREERRSSEDDINSIKKKWIGKRPKPPGSGRIPFPSYSAVEFSNEIQKRFSRRKNESAESLKGSETVEEQPRLKDFNKKDKSMMERNPYWKSKLQQQQQNNTERTDSSGTSQFRPSGIFNKSPRRMPPRK